jgi:PHS family inorganic phosphate transporter-like MFS transporter
VIIGPLATKGALPGAKGPDATPWLPHVLEIFAVFMLLGVFTSSLVPETARKSLEQLAGEVPGTPEYDPDLSGRGRPNNNGTDKLGPEQQV